MPRNVSKPLLKITDLVKHFPGPKPEDTVHAVNGVSFSIAPGETLGLVGESGSGKSTIGRAILRLLTPTNGTIQFNGNDVSRISLRDFRPLRGDIQIVFQDPYSALNPRKRIGKLIDELLMLHTNLPKWKRAERVLEVAEKVHLNADLLTRFPNELSGGQLQRVCIARAIATEPKLIVLDEPTSSLDLSVRSGILELLQELQRDIGVGMLFISHDLDTVRLISDRIIVLYLGSIVEYGSSDDIFTKPAHPYTQSLLSANLSPDPDDHLSRFKLTGEMPSPIHLPPGCPFEPRCPIAIADCTRGMPAARNLNGEEHTASCIRIDDGSNELQLRE